MSEDKNKSRYQVSVPIYEFIQEARVSFHEDTSAESGIEDNVNSISDLDSIRYETSDIHINSALFFADEVKRIEKHLNGDSDTDREDSSDLRIDTRLPIGNRHDLYVISSVVSSISALEALVNEFYDRHLERAEGIEANFVKEQKEKQYMSNREFYQRISNFNEVEDRDFEYKPTLQKYQYLLAFADSEVFNRGQEPYQTVSLVNRFRNHLVHAETEWIDSDELPSIGESLEGKFGKNPIQSDLPHPRSYLSFDCARWSIEGVFSFLNEFYERIGVEPPAHVGNKSGNLWEYDSSISVNEVEDSES